MLKLVVKGQDFYDERTGEFCMTKDTTLNLEHSLIAISKWESKWHKPFLSSEAKTNDELIDYIRCMTISQNVDPKVYYGLSMDDMKTIESYMGDEMTATKFNDRSKRSGSRSQVITSELIYSWMVSLQIPFECEKWHINRLLTLIRVCNIENSPKKRMKNKDVLKQNSQLNEARRRAMHTTG